MEHHSINRREFRDDSHEAVFSCREGGITDF